MKSQPELCDLALRIYWKMERGRENEAAEILNSIQLEARRELASGIMTCLSCPRGSEAQVRSLEEIGQDAKAIIENKTT